MRYRYVAPRYREAWQGLEQDLALGLTEVMGQIQTGMKSDARGQVRAAGLGARLANTWQGRVYPQGVASLDPSAYVWSRAPVLIDAYWRGASIAPHAGHQFLWIPTRLVPKAGRKAHMTPQQVEESFGRPLIVRLRANGQGGVALIDLAGVRAAPRGRNLKYGPKPKPRLQVMFILTRGPITVAPRLDVDAIPEKWAGQFQPLLNDRLR